MPGKMSAVTTPAAKARCMKPYWRNSGMASVVVADHAHRGAVERGQRRVAQEVARPAVEHQPAEGGPARDGRSIHGGDIVLEAPAAGSSVGIIVAAGGEAPHRSP